MAASLIKLTGENFIKYFTPSQVVKIEYMTNSSQFSIVLTGNQLIYIDTPSPANALARLVELETAMTSGTNMATITTNAATATTTTSTTTTTTQAQQNTTTQSPA